jgi:hypothetical protein
MSQALQPAGRHAAHEAALEHQEQRQHRRDHHDAEGQYLPPVQRWQGEEGRDTQR